MREIPQLLGGLALFLYGMNIMGKGLELLAGNRLQGILEKLTSNKILGILVGAAVTAIIQSSSATTVMAVGFVNSKVLTLTQAVYIIMGANIGTTVTGQILRLDIATIAPVLAFIGMTMTLFIKKRKYRYTGSIVFGLGILFMGMDYMGQAVTPLKENPAFASMIASSSNPLIAILVGAGVTAILQSSSATNGILQTLAATGLVSFRTSFFIILGQNIGTCITSIIASMGSSKNAKRAAISHVLFNLIGTVLFSVLAFTTPIISWVQGWTPDAPKAQIANLHTMFNIVTTILLIPFTTQLVKAANLIITGEDSERTQAKLAYITNVGPKDSILMISNIKQEILRMLKISRENIQSSIGNFIEFNEEASADIEYNEEVIDYLNTEIVKASVKTMSNNLGKEQYEKLSQYIKIASNIERIGDYAYNVNNLAKEMSDKGYSFSDIALEELTESKDLIDDLFVQVTTDIQEDDFDIKLIRTSAFLIQDMIEEHRNNHVERMKEGYCTTEAGLLYDKYYTYLTRVRDHLINVANSFSAIGD